MGLMTLTFDLLTLKMVCESHLRWGTFIPHLGTLYRPLGSHLGTLYRPLGSHLGTLYRPLGSQVIRLYATDGWTKATLTAPFPMGGGIITCRLQEASIQVIIFRAN